MNSTAKPLDQTAYHVLEQVDNAPTFRLANEVNAASAEAAPSLSRRGRGSPSPSPRRPEPF